MGARDTFALPDAGAIGLVGIHRRQHDRNRYARADAVARIAAQIVARIVGAEQRGQRSEEHTSELQSLMRNSYADFCLKKKNTTNIEHINSHKHDKTSNTTHI